MSQKVTKVVKEKKSMELKYVSVPTSASDNEQSLDRAFDALFEQVLKADKLNK